MKLTRALPTQPHRDAWLAINLDALEHNVRWLRSQIPAHVGLMAIIKADAYGHGAVMTLPTLLGAGITQLGVASIDEALQIRDAFGDVPILVVGPTPSWAFAAALQHSIQLTLYDASHRDQLAALATTASPAHVHIKVDTGMHRIGVPWQDAPAFIQQCQALPQLQVQGVFSHLACTGDADFTALQHQRFIDVLGQLDTLPPERHLMNSSGALQYPQLVTPEQTLVRLGLAMWGYNERTNTPLRPVMQLKARVVQLQTVDGDDGISYNHAHARQPGQHRTIATLPIGYADGLPRGLSNRMAGQLIRDGITYTLPQVGTITMDQLMLDVSSVPDRVQMGEAITLLGENHTTLSDWAATLNTIEYELMCALRVRLPRTYVREAAPVAS